MAIIIFKEVDASFLSATSGGFIICCRSRCFTVLLSATSRHRRVDNLLLRHAESHPEHQITLKYKLMQRMPFPDTSGLQTRGGGRKPCSDTDTMQSELYSDTAKFKQPLKFLRMRHGMSQCKLQKGELIFQPKITLQPYVHQQSLLY